MSDTPTPPHIYSQEASVDFVSPVDVEVIAEDETDEQEFAPPSTN